MASTHISPYLLGSIELNEHGDIGWDQLYRLEIHKKYQQKLCDILADSFQEISQVAEIKLRYFLELVQALIADPETTFSAQDADQLVHEIQDEINHQENIS